LSSAGQATQDQQATYAVNTIGDGGTGNWYAVRDSGGLGNIQNIGRQIFTNAQNQGIIGSGTNVFFGANADGTFNDTPALTNSDFNGLNDSDITGDAVDSTGAGSNTGMFDSGSGFGAGSSPYTSTSPQDSAGSATFGGPITATLGDGTTQTIQDPNIVGSGGGGDPPESSVTMGDGPSESNVFGSSAMGTGFGTSPGDGSTGVPGVSSQGTGNFGSFDSSSASNATSDMLPSAPGSGATTAGIPVSGNVTTGAIPGVSSPSVGTPATAPSGTNPSGSGSPVDITSDQPEINAANTIAKAATGIGTSISNSEGNLAGAGTSWLGSIFSAGTSVLVRTSFVAAGLVILLGAFLFFYIDSKAANNVVKTI
jgi:hypothetical protein